MKFDVDNPTDRAVLMAARSWGVSPRRFLDQIGATVTHYSYNDYGQIVRSVSKPDSEWSDDDRDAAMALLAYEASLCGGCKQPLDETTDPAHEYAYRAELPIRCHRCTAAEVAGEKYQDHPHPSALMIPLRLETHGNPDRDHGGE